MVGGSEKKIFLRVICEEKTLFMDDLPLKKSNLNQDKEHTFSGEILIL